MDIDLPGIDGIEATAVIKANFPAIHIVMQTVFEDDDKLFRAIQAGAEGYILKKTPPAKILEAIAEVHSGGAPMTPSIAARTLQLFRSGIKPASDKTDTNLNPRQKEILESIVNGMSYRLIAEKYFISVETVRYHVKNIYEILQVHSRFELMAKRSKP
jgi:DNA-binding NarL/FixJ family response regulator